MILLKCYDHSSGQDFQHRLCNSISSCYADLEPLYVRDNDSIIILDSGDFAGPLTTDFYLLNKSGIQNLNLNWQPQCLNYKSSSGYSASYQIFSIDEYFKCSSI